MQKYCGMRWMDPDGPVDVLLVADQDNMEFQRGRDAPGWCIIGTHVEDGTMEPWAIEGDVIDLIADCEQPVELNVEVVVNDELRAANDARMAEEKAKRTGKQKGNKRRRQH
jgi:hypothetical protein